MGRVLLWLFMCAVIVAAYRAPGAEGFASPEAARIIFFHVPAAMSCVIFFAIGSWFAIRFLRQKAQMDDLKSLAAIEMGTLMCVLATVTGSIFAYMQWNTPWNWDPRETSIVAQLLIYAAYFALRFSVTDARRRASLSAGYAVFALVTVPFLIFIVPRIMSSLHPENTVFSSTGLDPTYRAVYWSAFAGYICVGIAVMRLRIAAGATALGRELEIGLEVSGTTGTGHRLLGPDDLPVGDPSSGVARGER